MPPSPSPTGTARTWRDRLRNWLGAPGSSRRIIVRNGAWEQVSYVTYAAVMFFLTPFIVHRLGDSLYGVWEIVLTLVGFLGFADLGVRPAAVHHIARSEGKGDVDGLNRFVNTAFVTFAVAGLVMLVIAIPLAYLLPRFWRIAPGFEGEATAALLIVAGQMALELPLNAFSAVLVGKQRYDRLGMIRLGSLVVRTTAIVIVLSEGLGLVALALVVAACSILEMMAFTVSAFRLEPGLRFAPRLISKDAIKSLLRFGGWATAVIVGWRIIFATDALVIGRAIDAAAVAFFAIGTKLAFYARDFLMVGVRVLEPATGALYGRGDTEGIRRVVERSVRVMLLLSGPVLAYLFVLGIPFLERWMGPEYAIASGGVLLIMTLGVLPSIASAPLKAVHYGTNRVRPYAILVALEALLNLGLSILFVGWWGIEGVALGTAIPAWLVQGLLVPWLICRHLGISFGHFVATTWVGPVLAGVVTFGVLRLVPTPDTAYSYPALFGLAGASVLIYAATAWILGRVVPALFGAVGRGETAA